MILMVIMWKMIHSKFNARIFFFFIELGNLRKLFYENEAKKKEFRMR